MNVYILVKWTYDKSTFINVFGNLQEARASAQSFEAVTLVWSNGYTSAIHYAKVPDEEDDIWYTIYEKPINIGE